jgi:hypothetical protein
VGSGELHLSFISYPAHNTYSPRLSKQQHSCNLWTVVKWNHATVHCCSMKDKVKLVLCLNSYALYHEGTWRSEDITPPILCLSTKWREWSVSHSCRFTPEERHPGTHWISGWVHYRFHIDAMKERNIFTAGNRTRAAAQGYNDWLPGCHVVWRCN